MIFNISGRSSTYLLVVPLLYLLLYGYLIILSGPFYLTRIDPDYVYLLNGMNCSIFNFDRIGHLDHPGTPFQLFLGWCIDLIYLLSGKESIVADVLSRPEHYLAWCSDILAVLLFLIMVWAGKIGKKHLGWSGAVILQLSPFFSPVMLDLSLRIMPDRFGFMCVFFLMTTLIDAIYSKTNSHSKSSNLIWGILSGIIAAIKINFLPILFIPFILATNKFQNYYA